MEQVKLPTFVKVLMNAEVMENFSKHPNEALHDKSAVRIIDPEVDNCFIVETNAIEPIYSGSIATIEIPNKITIQMPGYTIEAELNIDGNMFCVKTCADLQSGISAFGVNVNMAVTNFKRALLNDCPKTFGTKTE